MNEQEKAANLQMIEETLKCEKDREAKLAQLFELHGLLDAYAAKFDELCDTPEYRAAFHKKSRAYYLATRIYFTLIGKEKHDIAPMLQELHDYHKGAARLLGSIRVKDNTTMVQLKDYLEKADHESAKRYLKEYEDRFNRFVGVVYGSKIAKRFSALVSDFLKDEAEFLQEQIANIESWAQKDETLQPGNRMPYFADMVKKMVGGEDGKGGVRAYHDNKLENDMHANMHVRELMLYQEQLKFVWDMLQSVREVDVGPKRERQTWHDALKTIHNMDQNIKDAREKFGNEELARSLERFAKKYHDEPEQWNHELSVRYNELLQPEYQERFVLHRVQEELTRLFQSRREELMKEQDRPRKRLIKLVSSILGPITPSQRFRITMLRRRMIAAADEEIKYTKADLAYRLTVNLAPMEKLVKSTREFDQLLDWKDRMMHSADEHDEHAAKVLPFAKVSLANALRNPNNFQSSMDTAGFMGQTVNSWLIRNEATGALTTPDTARYTDRIMNQRRMKSTMKRWNSLIAAFNRYLKERFLISPNDLVHVNLQELMLARGVVHG